VLEDPIPEPDQLGPLVAQGLQDRPQLGQRGVGLVEIEEPSHRRILVGLGSAGIRA
jgi:hypothetical protein